MKCLYIFPQIIFLLFLGFSSCNNKISNSDSVSNSEKAITSFTFKASNNSSLSKDYEGSIEENSKKITATILNLKNKKLNPSISISPNATITPNSGTEQDFTNPITYKVTAQDGSSVSYDVTLLTENQPTVSGTLSGNFKASAHETTGKVTISSDLARLQLENFKSTKGPDLNIYLFISLSNHSDYIDLGDLSEDLQGKTGSHTFKIPTNTDLNKYRYVSVWCVQASVHFGYAKLSKN